MDFVCLMQRSRGINIRFVGFNGSKLESAIQLRRQITPILLPPTSIALVSFADVQAPLSTAL